MAHHCSCACHGHEEHHDHHHEHDHNHEHENRKPLIVRLVLSAVLVLAALILPLPGWLKICLYLLAYIISAYDILWNSVQNIMRGHVFDEHFLMSVASVGALCLGEYMEGTAVMALYQLGEMLQDMAVDKSRRSITELMDMRPDFAWVKKDEEWVQVSPENVEIGTYVRVLPGERIPLDGSVAQGVSTVDTSALTGESLPADVKAGSQVLSGCVNLSGELIVCTEKASGESTAARILEMAEHASAHKSRPQKFMTRFARVYTPAVVALAVLLAVIPPLITGGGFGEWIKRALTFLVISCPCALVISVPLTFFSGIGGASRKGILIKGAAYLEKLNKVNVAVYDKTGTLTKGVFTVESIQSTDMDEKELLRLTAAVEKGSHHPIARSIVSAAEGRILPRAENMTEIAGMGVSGTVEGKEIVAGNEGFLRSRGVFVPQLEKKSGTMVLTAIDGIYAGCICIADAVKEHAKAALDKMRELGVEKQVILSGDKQEIAQHIGRQVGADAVYAQLMPDDKVKEMDKIHAEMKTGGTLIYVGDGVNDAPVLAKTDVGVAMGALGSDAAIETADVVLMDDDPLKLPLAVRIARKTMRICRQNIVFALGVKAVVMILGALGYASMWLAVFADVGVCLIAVANAMRAMKNK